jgi:hypothetical protein
VRRQIEQKRAEGGEVDFPVVACTVKSDLLCPGRRTALHSINQFLFPFNRAHQVIPKSMSSRQNDYRRGAGGAPGGGYRDRSRSPDRNRLNRDRDADRYMSRGNSGRDFRDNRDSRDSRDGRDTRDSRDNYRDGRDLRDYRDGRDSYRGSRYSKDDRAPTDRSQVAMSSSQPSSTQDSSMDVDQSPAPTARKVPISLEELIKQKEQEKLALEKVQVKRNIPYPSSCRL